MSNIHHLKDLVKDCTTVDEVKMIVDDYFNNDVVWSLEKDEYVNHMDEHTKRKFCQMLFKEEK